MNQKECWAHFKHKQEHNVENAEDDCISVFHLFLRRVLSFGRIMMTFGFVRLEEYEFTSVSTVIMRFGVSACELEPHPI